MGESHCDNCENVAELKRRLVEAEESLQAIKRGEVDAFVVNTPQGEQVYTLQGTDTIYRKILEEMAEGAATLSDEDIILYSNISFAKMAGRPLENVIGTSFFDYVSPDDFESLSAQIKNVNNDNGGVNGEFRVISSDGSVIPVQASLKSISTSGSKVVYVVVTDLSEKEALTKRSMESDRFSAIGRVTAMVAHDVRGPLNVVSQAAEMLELNQGDAPRMLQLIRENTSRALTILSELRENTKDINLSRRETDVDSLIRTTIKEMMIPPSVSTSVDSEGESLVLLDPDYMRRVFSNVITNAIEAMPDGGSLKVAISNLPARVEVEIADTGVGIPDEIVDKIFDMFISTKSKGTGLGLALCKRVVQAHGGKISFTTKRGKGTSFTISLPSSLS